METPIEGFDVNAMDLLDAIDPRATGRHCNGDYAISGVGASL